MDRSSVEKQHTVNLLYSTTAMTWRHRAAAIGGAVHPSCCAARTAVLLEISLPEEATARVAVRVDNGRVGSHEEMATGHAHVAIRLTVGVVSGGKNEPCHVRQ